MAESLGVKNRVAFLRSKAVLKMGQLRTKKKRISLIQLKKEIRRMNVKEKFNQIHKFSDMDTEIHRKEGNTPILFWFNIKGLFEVTDL